MVHGQPRFLDWVHFEPWAEASSIRTVHRGHDQTTRELRRVHRARRLKSRAHPECGSAHKRPADIVQRTGRAHVIDAVNFACKHGLLEAGHETPQDTLGAYLQRPGPSGKEPSRAQVLDACLPRSDPADGPDRRP